MPVFWIPASIEIANRSLVGWPKILDSEYPAKYPSQGRLKPARIIYNQN